MSNSIAETPAFPAETPKIGIAWGDDITEERKAELHAILSDWDAETDHGERKGPFDVAEVDLVSEEGKRLRLTGADVFYLAAHKLIGTIVPIRATIELNEDLHTFSAVLCDPDTVEGKLDLSALHLEGANLSEAQLQGAILRRAQLGGADIWGTLLAGATLVEANLTGARLFSANLVGADLRGARLDHETRLDYANLAGVSLDQIVFDDTNLTIAELEGVAPLGDDKRARATKVYGRRKSQRERIEDYEAAVRANRLLATALRAQGLAEDADVFAYRAQIMQRKLNFRRRRFGRWSFSWLFAALSGYGYRLWRIFFAYGLILSVFALIFWALGVHSFADASTEPWYQALWDSLLVSLSAIHGRAVFEQLGAWTPAAWVAAIESVVGIVIEGVFVAMLIQRLFR